jgi:alpha-tubulin suppressor-like RCC1 family protein
MVRKFMEKAKMVASGNSHTLILSKGGLVFATGANSFG